MNLDELFENIEKSQAAGAATGQIQIDRGDDPTLGEWGAGLGAEVAGGMASQALGAMTGPGYFLIAPVGGFLSNIAAQKIEGRESISIGRALVAAVANLIPGPTGKIAKGVKGVSKIAMGEAYKGAAIGAADASAQAIIDEGRLPTGRELGSSVLVGGAFGGTIGAGVSGVRKAMARHKLPKVLEGIITKETSPEEIDRLIATSPEYKDKILAEIKELARKEGSDLFDRPDGISLEAIAEEASIGHLSKAAEGYAKIMLDSTSDAGLQSKTWLDRMLRPSRMMNREVMNIIRASKAEPQAVQAVASKIQNRLDSIVKSKGEQEGRTFVKNVARMFEGEEYDHRVLKDALGDLEKAKEMRLEITKALRQNIVDAKEIGGIEGDQSELIRMLDNSIRNQDYQTRPYRWHNDRKWKPSDAMRREAGEERYNELAAERLEVKRQDAQKEGLNPADVHLTRADEVNLKNQAAAEMREWDKVSARAKSRQDSEQVASNFERILKSRREIGPKQRAYLGEIKDPAENIYQTLAKSSRLQSAMQGDLNLLRYLKENPNSIHRGAIVNPKDPHLMPSDFEPIALQTKGLGENVYVHRDVNTALKGFYYNNDKVQHKNPMMGGLADLWGTALGGSKAAKTIFNPASYAPQFTGGLTATVANGVFPSLAFGRDMGLGFRMALKDFFAIDNLSAKRQTPEQRKNFLDMIQRAAELNLLPSSIVASDLRDTLNRGAMSEWIQKRIEPFSKAYNVADKAMRIVNWMGAMRQMKKVFPDATQEEIEVIAARLVNDTFPNYDFLSNSVKGGSRIGVLSPFVAFTAELMRNMWHQGRYSAQMALGKFGKDIGAGHLKPNLKEMKKLGWIRGASLAAVAGGGGGAVWAFNELQSGLDKHQTDQFGQTIAAPWDKGKQLAIKLNKDGRTGAYFDPEYLVPHTLAFSAFKAGLAEKPMDALVDLFKNNFLGQGSFLIENIGAITTGKDRNGKEISFKENELARKKDQIEHYIREVFEPGAFREIEKWNKRIAGRKDALETHQLVMRLAGFRYNDFDIYEDGVWRIRGDAGTLNEIRSRLAKSRAKDLPHEFERTHRQLEQARGKIMDSIRRHHRNLKSLGLTEDEAATALKDAGLSSADQFDVLTGGYTPMSLDRPVSSRERYEALGQTPEERKEAIKRAKGSVDRKEYQSYVRFYRQDMRQPNAELSPVERVLQRMDTRTRLEKMVGMGLNRSDMNRIKRWKRLRLLTNDMIRALPES